MWACAKVVLQDDFAMISISMELYLDSVDIIQAPLMPPLGGGGGMQTVSAPASHPAALGSNLNVP